MQSVEKAIKYLEYGLSFCRWGIDSLRSFPIYINEKITNTKTTDGL
jgi:hypothetical protein